jgi:rhodanese-related sulfurtransferase
MVVLLEQEVVAKDLLHKMNKQFFYILIIFSTTTLSGQNTLSELLKKYNSKKINYISVQELAMPKTNAIILDAREINEYNVSHIKDAYYVGYNDFKIETVLKHIQDKNQKIVVYCSIGIRSETIAHKIKKAGFTNVLNLYGGIFEWKNNNYPVYTNEGLQTENVHVFSNEWSKWLKKGVKIY